MKSKNKKILISLLACGMLASLTTANYINANESEEVESIQEETEVEETEKVLADEVEENNSIENEVIPEIEVEEEPIVETQTAALQSTRAVTDAAFPESSKELHDAIMKKYPDIDASPNGNGDGVISVGEAASWSGTGIALGNQGLNGTIDGIEKFQNIKDLNLSLNNFSGIVGDDFWTMTKLTNVNLGYNNFESVSLSSNIINYTNLQYFYMDKVPFEQTNVLDTLVQIPSLVQISLYGVTQEGSIPTGISNLTNLTTLSLSRGNYSGEVPMELYSLPKLQNLQIANNPLLTGNPSIGFATSTKMKYLDIRGTSLIQARPDISTLLESNGGTFLYNNLAEALLSDDKTNIVDGLTQADIDNAQVSANYISDATEKKQWQDNIDLAQRMLDAKEQVSELFGDETKTNLANSTTQNSIDDAKEVVSALPDGQLKTDLQNDIDLAQSMLDATTTVNKMFNDDGTITDVVNQSVIDNAQSKVDVLPEGSLKTELQDKIDEAQKQFNEKDAKEKVENLFTDGTHTDIIDSLTQGNIDEAQKAVDKLPSGNLRDDLQKEIDKAQEMLDARNKVEDLFTDETHTDIPDDLTQTDIDDAQKAVDKLPSGDLKEELQKEIDKAQDMLDAKDAVDELFNDKKDNLADSVTQDDIDNAQDLVNKLPDGTLKEELQKEIDKAQDMLNAKDAAKDLLDKDGNLNSGVTQKDIDKVQDLVNKLPDGELKEELQAIIDEAQKQLDALSNPSIEPPVQKPSVNPSTSSTTGGNSVTTGDETNVSLYLGILVSAAGLVILTKKRRESKQ